ncbi:hypothetical protein N8H74_04800 [Pseudomonas sp. B2M1-30]|uniref:Uncharacterized protein n=1 Tax=Pseudomonas koreensis TaxID=198620 RepID=A0A9X2XEF0_9PSED|nr:MULTISPECIES: hypothetical protein [Pseudomonas]MBV4473428.1 hypothetical protein [Pseudomonas botevensis]MCU0117559.1 hypothetical protein [Pseudomonas sp. B2M1-30]MCU7247019.1 hypothetical protein [Pseudomonas koreensis]MCU7259095.1 hypothetical protein [Pseudomonas koreensis]
MNKGLSDANLNYVLAVIESAPNTELGVMCEHLQIDSRDLLNQLAISVARLFITGSRDFHSCDEVMNTVISDIVDLSMHADMPLPAFSIYQAFDAGEYWHSDDDRDVFPWEKWTRPELERILREVDDGANGLSK